MQSCLAHGGRGAALIALLVVSACSQTLDWREVRPEGSGVVAVFPCKPSTDTRTVTLGGARVRMLLTACSAGGATWALAHADVEDPSRVTPALAALRAASEANLAAPAEHARPLQVSGMTPNPQTARVRLAGKLPDGEAVTLEAGYFVKGTRVFQVTAMGAQLGGESVATFFDSLRLPS
jgi:hypothetical protein